MKTQVVIDRQPFDDPPFVRQGRYRRINKLFGGELNSILEGTIAATWEPAV